MKRLFSFVFLCLPLKLVTACASHPHVFIDAKLKIFINEKGVVEKLVEDWQFDPIFSAGVIMDFSKNKKTLTEQEKQKLQHTIYQSMAYFGYFQAVEANGKKVKILAPKIFDVTYDKIVKIHLETKPSQILKLEKGSHYVFRVFDPSFYVNVAYKKDTDIHVYGLPKYCKAKIFRPDPDQILTEDAQSLSEDFFADPTNAFDLATQLATRLTITC